MFQISAFRKGESNLLFVHLQDQYERVILNLYVKPQQQIVSYLTPLTGLILYLEC